MLKNLFILNPPFPPFTKGGTNESPPFKKGGKVGIFLLLASCFLLLSSCGSDSSITFDVSIPSQNAPIVTRVAPANGKAGDVIAVFGVGFSVEASNNVVVFGNISTTATNYGLVAPAAAGEVEQLTVTIPAGATVGANSVYVNVFENTSNTNISFTINP